MLTIGVNLGLRFRPQLYLRVISIFLSFCLTVRPQLDENIHSRYRLAYISFTDSYENLARDQDNISLVDDSIFSLLRDIALTG